MTEIKICGLFSEADIAYVNEARPDFIGFILRFPKSHRNITAEKAAKLRRLLADSIRPVGVFVNQPPAIVAETAAAIGLDAIQLHGSEDEAYLDELRGLTNLPLWKAFKITSREDLERAFSCTADEILLDGGLGEGKTFDWSLLRDASSPFTLAGGLTPQNMAEAIRKLHPKRIDLSSGVETDGKKDRDKILAAVGIAKEHE